MTKLTLTKVYTTKLDKEGNELKSKKGIPYTRMSIKAQEYGDKLISGFQNKDNKDWKEGDTVEVEIKENGEYLNFETPKKEEVASGQITEMLTKILNIQQTVKSNQALSWDSLEEIREKIGLAKFKLPPARNAMGIDSEEVEEIPF